MKTPLILVTALILTAGVSETARAQGRSHLGPQIGYNFDYEALVVGAQFSTPLGTRLEFYPSFNFWNVDAGSLLGFNADIKYRVPMQTADWLYLGGGLNVTRRKVGSFSNTDAGLNLLAGIEGRRGTIHPFGEARITIGDGTALQLVAGINFTLGGHQ